MRFGVTKDKRQKEKDKREGEWAKGRWGEVATVVSRTKLRFVILNNTII